MRLHLAAGGRATGPEDQELTALVVRSLQDVNEFVPESRYRLVVEIELAPQDVVGNPAASVQDCQGSLDGVIETHDETLSDAVPAGGIWDVVRRPLLFVTRRAAIRDRLAELAVFRRLPAGRP
jgi:hypothetical protein